MAWWFVENARPRSWGPLPGTSIAGALVASAFIAALFVHWLGRKR